MNSDKRVFWLVVDLYVSLKKILYLPLVRHILYLTTSEIVSIFP